MNDIQCQLLTKKAKAFTKAKQIDKKQLLTPNS